MGRALIIGCGGVAGVVIHKCCQNSDVFEEIMIASRTKSKCDAIKEKLDGTTATKIRTAKVDADNVDELCALIDEYKPDIVMNIALPDAYIEHGNVEILKKECGIDAETIEKKIIAAAMGL